MVSAAFLAVPSLWGIQSATTIAGSPSFKIKIISAGTKFIQASNFTIFKNPFETDSNKKKRGSLGHICHQVQIEQQKFQRNVNNNFKFSPNRDEVQDFEMNKLLLPSVTYLNVTTRDSYVPNGDNLCILDVIRVKFSDPLSPKPPDPPWAPPWPPPFMARSGLFFGVAMDEQTNNSTGRYLHQKKQTESNTNHGTSHRVSSNKNLESALINGRCKRHHGQSTKYQWHVNELDFKKKSDLFSNSAYLRMYNLDSSISHDNNNLPVSGVRKEKFSNLLSLQHSWPPPSFSLSLSGIKLRNIIEFLPPIAITISNSNGVCPNICFGHGVCEAKDVCSCERNWQGGDCSFRTCPFGVSHVDITKGDFVSSCLPEYDGLTCQITSCLSNTTFKNITHTNISADLKYNQAHPFGQLTMEFEKLKTSQLTFLLPVVSVIDMPPFLWWRNNVHSTQWPHIELEILISGVIPSSISKNKETISSIVDKPTVFLTMNSLTARERVRVLLAKIPLLLLCENYYISNFVVRLASDSMRTFILGVCPSVSPVITIFLVVRLASDPSRVTKYIYAPWRSALPPPYEMKMRVLQQNQYNPLYDKYINENESTTSTNNAKLPNTTNFFNFYEPSNFFLVSGFTKLNFLSILVIKH